VITIRSEVPEDGAAVETLLDFAFEPDRRRRPSYRLRDGITRVDELCFVAETEGRVIGVVRFWPIAIEGKPALLLGPIAVHPAFEGRGNGTRLIETGLAAARQAGFSVVVAIGAASYLGRFGFEPAAPKGFVFPQAVDPARFLILGLEPGALDRIGRRIERANAASAA
jgi:predicted N-acetyltransferase YhbS